uniref:Uncharacterized protein n=1 Tax=Vespula pensylvanica TaxID=30213 RepID=A0A834P4F4_VESPE|nr:hypothetical protein H0235_007191 [Vespula pensylvanica]
MYGHVSETSGTRAVCPVPSINKSTAKNGISMWGTVTLTLESVSLQIIRIMGCKWGRMMPLRQQPRTLTVFESLPSFYTPLEPTFSSSKITSSVIKNHDKTYLLYAVSI